MTTALPPYVLHSSTPISALDALSALDAFLITANDNPAFRPDSTLSERGPVSSSTSANPNLVLHHLNRIKLGLEGVRIGAAEIEAEDCVAQAQADEERASRKRKRDETQDVPDTPKGLRYNIIPSVIATTEEDGEPMAQIIEEQGGEWEDKDDYELAQEDEMLDLNTERDPAGGLEQPANSQEAEDMMTVKETPQKNAPDKEERKRLKKLKQKQEKQKAEREGNARNKKDKKSVKVDVKA